MSAMELVSGVGEALISVVFMVPIISYVSVKIWLLKRVSYRLSALLFKFFIP